MRLIQALGQLPRSHINPERYPPIMRRHHKHRTRRICEYLIAAVVLFGLQIHAYAQSTSGHVFQEIGISGGATLNPSAAPFATIAYGIGKGSNTASLQISRSYLGNCGLGLGAYACDQPGNANYEVTVSGYRLTDFSVNYQRDLYHPAAGRATIYGGFGGGYFKSSFTMTTVCGIFCYGTLPSPSFSQQKVYVNTVGYGLNSGVRISLWKGIGLRGSIEAWLVPGSSAVGNTSPAINKDGLIRTSIGLFFRRNL